MPGAAGRAARPSSAAGRVVRLPRISNFTDVDALAAEPGVLVRFAASPAELADADLVVLPGTRATVADLAWLRERGLAAALADAGRGAGSRCSASAAATRCSAGEIDDQVESGAGRGRPAWDCCRCGSTFGADKVLGRPRGTGYGAPVRGYEIHHGVATVDRGRARTRSPAAAGPGAVCGTHVARHPGERRVPAGVPDRGRARWPGGDFTVAPDTSFAAARQARLDTLADLVAEHLDTGRGGPAHRARARRPGCRSSPRRVAADRKDGTARPDA